MAVSMVSVQHPVEDFSSPSTLSPGIQRSPVKLLNTLPAGSGTLPCKRPLEDLDFGADADPGNDPEAKPAKSLHLDSTEKDPSLEKENIENVQKALTGATPEKMYQVPPALNGHRDFPCIWLSDASPSRAAEGADRSPNSVSQPSPRESQEAPSSISPPNLTSPLPPVGTPMKLPTEPPSLAQAFNHSPIVNGILAGHGPPPLLEREPSLEGSPDGENCAVEVCPECHKVFKRKVYLQRHMEREHWSTAKVFKCEDCSYETKHQSNLSVHRRTHTGERPYHCGACGQRYTQGHLLKSHIRSRHGGSMEFYNLDKKSESTRGRKSLDMKHDPTHHGLKVDKISTLLQVAAANQQMRPLQTPPKFGNLLAPPLPPFFGTMRPMMAPPLGLPGGLLSAPRFFPLGNLVGNNLQFSPPGAAGLMPTMQQSLQMLANQNSMNLNGSLSMENVEASTKASQEAAPAAPKQQKLDLDGQNQMPLYFRGNCSPSPPTRPAPISRTPPQDDGAAVPQDLSKKPAPAQIEAQPQDLSSIASGRRYEQPYEKEPGEVVPESEELLMQSAASQPDTNLEEAAYLQRASNPDLKKAATLLALNLKECRGGNCLYAKQLRDLRKNVLRMLSVFTPDLGVENGIDYETDTVDQLLHEVIYSNIDEEAVGKE